MFTSFVKLPCRFQNIPLLFPVYASGAAPSLVLTSDPEHWGQVHILHFISLVTDWLESGFWKLWVWANAAHSSWWIMGAGTDHSDTQVSRPAGAFCTVELVLRLRGVHICSLRRHCRVLAHSFIDKYLLDNYHIQGPATGISTELLVLVLLVHSRHSYTDPPMNKKETLWTLSPNKKQTTIQVTLWKVLGYRGYNMGWALQC